VSVAQEWDKAKSLVPQIAVAEEEVLRLEAKLCAARGDEYRQQVSRDKEVFHLRASLKGLNDEKEKLKKEERFDDLTILATQIQQIETRLQALGATVARTPRPGAVEPPPPAADEERASQGTSRGVPKPTEQVLEPGPNQGPNDELKNYRKQHAQDQKEGKESGFSLFGFLF